MISSSISTYFHDYREMMMTRKLKRKKIVINDDNSDVEVIVKRKLRKRYKKQKCAYVAIVGVDSIPCRKNAVGKSTLCKEHGGNPIDHDNLVSVIDDKSVLGNSKFDAKVHPLLFIDLSRQGMSEVEIAASFEIGKDTLLKWAERYKEFATAFEIGQALHEAWWLQQGKSGLHNVRNFNTVLFKFLTGNKLGYSEKIENKNLNMNVHGVLLVPSKISPEDWAAQNEEPIPEAEVV